MSYISKETKVKETAQYQHFVTILLTQLARQRLGKTDGTIDMSFPFTVVNPTRSVRIGDKISEPAWITFDDGETCIKLEIVVNGELTSAGWKTTKDIYAEVTRKDYAKPGGPNAHIPTGTLVPNE